MKRIVRVSHRRSVFNGNQNESHARARTSQTQTKQITINFEIYGQ